MAGAAEALRLPEEAPRPQDLWFVTDFDEVDEELFGENGAAEGGELKPQDIPDTSEAEEQLRRLEHYERKADGVREHANQQRQILKEKLEAVDRWEEGQLKPFLGRILFYTDNLTRFLGRVFRESGEKTKSLKLVNGTVKSSIVGGGCEEVDFDEFEKWAVEQGLVKELITTEIKKSLDKTAVKNWTKENEGEIPPGIDISTGERKFSVKTVYEMSKKKGA